MSLRGVIASFQGRTPAKTSPLVCTHIAEGHSKAVLAVTATDDVLFSSSKGNCSVGKIIVSIMVHEAFPANEFDNLYKGCSHGSLKASA